MLRSIQQLLSIREVRPLAPSGVYWPSPLLQLTDMISDYLINKGMIMVFDVSHVRAQFPMLNSAEPIFFDNPAGTQVPQRVIDAVSDYFLHMNANSGGGFASSKKTDAMVQS